MKYYELTIKYSCVREEPGRMPLKLFDPPQVLKYMQDAFEPHPFQESLWVICLNRKNYPLGRSMITLGTATTALAHPREVYRAAILAGACAIVVVHNHPSGDPAPSTADIQVTRLLREAGKAVDIELLDHVVIGTPTADPRGLGYYSFRESGMI